MCDIILASPTAVFGQPEINLGVIPGGGGTQRLVHAIGKSRTMELVLTGRNFSAVEAESWGVVSRVVEEGEGKVVSEAVKLASVIAGKGRLAVQAGKEAVNAAYEQTLEEGLKTERRLFHALFATEDQTEGVFVRTSLVYLQLTLLRRYARVCGEEESRMEEPISLFCLCKHTLYRTTPVNVYNFLYPMLDGIMNGTL